jgi:3-oxoacyl-[acyl-carrier protein] reductase
MPERISLVTGGSRGIGRSICIALAETGPVAVNCRRSVDDAKETLSLVEQAGGEGIVVCADVDESAAVDEMFAEVEEALGPVSVLVNNAGIRADGLAARMSDDAWDDVMRTNLFGTFACSRRALRTMVRERWGRIVNVASVAGLHGSAGQANYSAAKAGIIGMTRTLAREVARRNITVNAVAPGFVMTDLTSGLKQAQTDRILSEIPLGRAGTTEEIADVTAFLCSERASYVTGAIVTVDGGMTA